jgi:hypothetical protein
MTDRRLLKVLPGGRSSPTPGPDGEAAQRPGPHGHYADPYAIPDGGSPADPAGTRGHLPAGCSGTRSRARLHLLPQVREDSERLLPARSPKVLPAPIAPTALEPPAPASLLGPDAPQPDARSNQSPDIAAGAGRTKRPYIITTAGAGRTSSGTVWDPGAASGQGAPADSGTSRNGAMAAGRHRRPLQPGAADPELLAKREVRALWVAQLLSSAGDQFGRVAIAVMVYGQTRSSLLTAVAYALTYLPPLLGGPSITRLAGQLDRRTLMIGLDVARAALIAAMILPGTRLWGLCALLFAAMLLGAPFSAARAALVRGHAPAGLGWMAGPSPAIGTIGYQAGQALGFLAGAGLVATVQPQRTLLIDALTFLMSACLVTALVRRRRPPPRSEASTHLLDEPHATASTLAPVRPPAEPAMGTGGRLVARSATLRTLVLLGWLAGFYVVPEGLAAPYARALGGGILAVGLLMAAMPAGAALGVLAFARLIRPPARAQLLGWLAMLSCAPLIFSALHPPLGAVLALWALAGLGTAYQLGAMVAFVRALGGKRWAAAESADAPAQAEEVPAPVSEVPAPAREVSAQAEEAGMSALGFAQAGLVAAQCLGFVVAGAIAQLVGPQAAVALAGLCGLAASTALTRMWGRAHTERTGSCALARGSAGRSAVSGEG